MFFPGMEQFYGPNLTVNIEYKAENIDKFSVAENDETMSFHADMSVNFWVVEKNGTQSDAVKILCEDFYFNFTVLVEGMEVKANVTSVSLNTINVTSTTFGTVDGKRVAQLLNEGLKYGLPFFNLYIESLKLVIPSSLFNNLFRLSDLVVKYHNQFLEAGLTPTFNPPHEGSVWMPKQDPWKYDQQEPCGGYSKPISFDQKGEMTVTNCPENEKFI